MTIRQNVLQEIENERNRQDKLWGTEFDDKNTPNDWVAYIVRYVSEGAYDGREAKYTPQRFREFLVKAAAISVAAIETLDRNSTLAARHYEA